MNKKEYFEELLDYMIGSNPRLEKGKMMSCDGIVYKKKVCCFFYGDKMVFKLGKDYDMETLGIKEYSYLNPFKNKGPMLAWYEVGYEYKDKWKQLAEIAYEKMVEELG